MSNIINITDPEYGAHVNKEDNKLAIQKALDKGGSIYMPDGVFRISDSLNLTSATRLFGEGTIKLTAKRHLAVLRIRQVKDVTIEDITLDGNFAEKSVDISGIILISDGSTNIILTKLKILNAGNFAVSAANASFLKVQECQITGFIGRGINFAFCNDTLIEANYIDGSVNEKQRGEHGIEIWGKYNHTRDSQRHVVSNNSVKNVNGGGIWTATVDDIIIIGNQAENCGDVCIDVEDTRNAQIVGNVARNGKNAAIASFYASENVVINANHAVQDQGFGPAIRIFGIGVSKKINISQNFLETFDSTVIATEQGVLKDSSIANNHIRTDSGMGIRMLEADRIHIKHNIFLANQANTGIAIEGGRYCLIENNYLHKLESYSISLISDKPLQGGIFLYRRNEEFDCSANEVVGNVIKGYDVSINVHCEGWYKSPNLIMGNLIHNIYVKGIESSILKQNTNPELSNKEVTPILY